MVFKKIILLSSLLLFVTFGMENIDNVVFHSGDFVRIKNLTSERGLSLNDKVGKIITEQEENGRWGVELEGEEKPISFDAINLDLIMNTVEDILQHEEKSKSRLLHNFNEVNPTPHRIQISNTHNDGRLTAFMITDYFLGKQKSEKCIQHYFNKNESAEKWIDQTEIENSLKHEILKIETKSGKKIFVIQFFPRIEMLGRAVANNWGFGQNLSGITQMIVIEKLTDHANEPSQFRIFQTWANGYDLKLWLNEFGTCDDKFNQKFFTKAREQFGQGKYLSQSEITKFIENVLHFNKYNKELEDKAKCMNHLICVNSLIMNDSLMNILQQPEDLIDYYIKENPENGIGSEILKNASEGQRACMAWYFPDMIWYPETFLTYQIYE